MQRSWKYGGWTLAGVLAAGALLDALANALQLVTPTGTYVGTMLLIVLTFGAHLLMKRRGVPWQYDSGIGVRLKGLGPSQLCFIVGIILLLWYPRAKDVFDMMAERKMPQSGPSFQFKKLE